jgi:hypothetical protein
MGPLFVWLIWMILLVPVGLVIGGLVMFPGLPLYWRIRSIPKECRRFRWKHALILPATVIAIQILATAGFAFFMIQEVRYSDDFYKSQGLTDWWRLPLDYPYEILFIDVTDHGSIQKTDCKGKAGDADPADFPEVQPQLFDVRAYYKKGPLVVGYIYEDEWRSYEKTKHRDTVWFSFDCSTGESLTYGSREDYVQGLGRLGFTEEPELVPVREQLDRYWAEH